MGVRKPKPRLPTQVEGVYTPVDAHRRPRVICSRCWSRPSVRLRRRGMDQESEVQTSLRVGREFVLVWTLYYPCANEDCFTYVAVHNDSWTGRMAPWIAERQLRGVDAATYMAGSTDLEGVWRDAEGTPKVTAAEPITVELRRDGPWLYIRPSGVQEDLPTAWTVADGEVKTRFASAAGQKVLEWFAVRGVQIDPLRVADARPVQAKVLREQEKAREAEEKRLKKEQRERNRLSREAKKGAAKPTPRKRGAAKKGTPVETRRSATTATKSHQRPRKTAKAR